MHTSWNPCSSSLIDMMANQAATNRKNHRMNGRRAPEIHISTSWVRSWLPRVKLPALRWTAPRAE
jgi:hypothetical protein